MAQDAPKANSLSVQMRAAAAAMAPEGVAPALQTPPPASAPAPAPAPKKVTTVIGADVPLLTGYVFRGIQQEFDPKFTIQPFVDFGIAASDKVTINVGTWNSFHTGSNKDALDGAWYESDVYASATFLAGKWKPGVLYTLYTSPAGGYEGVGADGSIGVNELAFYTSYDDSASSLPLSPKFVLAVELGDASADFGTEKGIYFEAGIAPTFKAASMPNVTFTVPVKIGTSLKDYYQYVDANLDVQDSKFGYFQFGGKFSVPISGITAGAWEFHAGMDFFVLPENRKFFQDGDDEPKSFKPVFNLGFSATF